MDTGGALVSSCGCTRHALGLVQTSANAVPVGYARAGSGQCARARNALVRTERARELTGARRPARGAQRFAEHYQSCVFLKFFGNANAGTKRLFRERLQTPLTPTFSVWRRGARWKAPKGCV